MPNAFPLLFSPFEIRGTEFRNRIFFSGHGTRLAGGSPGDELIAYHAARAKGGAALIVTELPPVEALSNTTRCTTPSTAASSGSILAPIRSWPSWV